MPWGPWLQPADITVEAQPTGRNPSGAPQGMDWHGSSGNDDIGPDNYADASRNDCSWNLARANQTFTLPTGNTFTWEGSCPADPGPNIAFTEGGATFTVGAIYAAADFVLSPYFYSGIHWDVYIAGRCVSLSDCLRFGRTSLAGLLGQFGPAPNSTDYGQWEPAPSGGRLQPPTIISATMQPVVTGPPAAGVEPVTSRWGVAPNTVGAPSWGPGGGDRDSNGGAFHPPPSGALTNRVWQSGDPSAGWARFSGAESVVAGDTSGSEIDIPSGVLAGALAWENLFIDPIQLGVPSFGRAPGGLIIAGISEDCFSSSPPNDIGGDGTTYDRTRSNVFPRVRVTMRPPRWRWWIDTKLPLRWRQRDDGLGVQAARRQRGGTSIQASLRHRAYR